MYLSRLILNPRSRQVQREIAEPYEMHRTIMHAWPEELPDAERVLFRLESNPRSSLLLLLVQSHLPPDWSRLDTAGERGYLLPEGEPPSHLPRLSVKSFDLRLQPGQVLAFRLYANPTVKRNARRVGLLREEEQVAWLARKAEAAGFNLLSVQTGHQEKAGGRIRRDGQTHDLTLLGVQFDGMLQVRDPDRLQSCVAQGIGSGKGLGFGLLSIAPPQI
ncbi:MAG: type I-E CRISPR-associated protein Cas6/Cse3/CasE [Chloroflexi bacterium]|nr:type I-E CRISPR-associated protein Cas6/Cse3/CasE [Chloroflexota bacterium]